MRLFFCVVVCGCGLQFTPPSDFTDEENRSAAETLRNFCNALSSGRLEAALELVVPKSRTKIDSAIKKGGVRRFFFVPRAWKKIDDKRVSVWGGCSVEGFSKFNWQGVFPFTLTLVLVEGKWLLEDRGLSQMLSGELALTFLRNVLVTVSIIVVSVLVFIVVLVVVLARRRKRREEYSADFE